MNKRNLTLAATLAPVALITATVALTANPTHAGYQWNLGPLQVTYSDFPSLS